jgi:hypothetical protein
VAPPGQDYDGLRPALVMYAAKDRPNNVLRPALVMYAAKDRPNNVLRCELSPIAHCRKTAVSASLLRQGIIGAYVSEFQKAGPAMHG